MTTARHAWGQTFILGLALCLAPAAWGATPSPEAVQLITLNLNLLDESVMVATVDGGAILYTRYLADSSIDLLITPRIAKSGEVEVRVEELHPSRMDGSRHPREVLRDDGTFIVVPGHEAFIPVANVLLEMQVHLEIAQLSSLPPGSCLGSSDPGMRPVDDGCCVGCGGSSVCGCVVYTSCGSCCGCGIVC